MDISVIVPTFNRRDFVLRTLSTLFAQSYPFDRFETIVVVDGSSDGTLEALNGLSQAHHLRVIEQENRGPAGARNSGYRAASSELVLFLDDDMLCDSGLIAAHVAAHLNAPQIIAFGAIFLSADSPPSLAAECFNQEIGAFHLNYLRDPESHWNETACVFSNTSVSKRLLCDVGGFDEAFRVREDLDLGIRLLAQGAAPCYVSDAVVHQSYTKSSKDLLTEAERFAAADVMFARKHPELRVRGHVNSAAQDPVWKRWIRKAAVSSTCFERSLLVPLCLLGQMFLSVPLLKNAGVRALRMRRRIHWLRKTTQLQTSDTSRD